MEQEPKNPESDQEKEPTLDELIDACREVLTPEDCEDLATMDFDEALGYIATLFAEQGLDSFEFLTEKGILEPEL